ncbi:MAG TPA: ATPase [Sphaerochaeta sp.]|jgi:V/A-type H+-transporting ATPase subunit E|nr:ATPase [Sphaerochaeta sp.]HPZ16015.1 ATPase [Sphaerochaeta sp.]
MATSDNRLLDGIIEQADKSAQKKIEEAKASASVILAEAAERIEAQNALLERELEQKLKLISLRLETNKASARRRAILAEVDDRYQMVMDRVVELFDAKRVSAHLSQWIAEATLGLDLREAKVSSSRKAPVSEAHLKEAARLIKNATGAEVTLHLDSKQLPGLGVVVSSLDETVSFNNQVDIRLRRFDRVIRTMIQEHA